MSDKLKIAEMLCTRFCHDIIGPVGAVNNGAEFLRDELKDVASQAADLIESSSKEAVARVQFYRQAYGVGAPGSPVSLDDTKTLSENYFAAGKIKLEWDNQYTDISNVEISYVKKKILLNLLVLSAAVLIRGGKVIFEIKDGKVVITAEGEKAMLQNNYELCLKGKLPLEEIDPRLIQCHYTHELAQESGTEIEINKDIDKVIFSFAI